MSGAPLRVDVVVLKPEGRTVGEVLEICAAARAAHEGGLRCALGEGPAERWVRDG